MTLESQLARDGYCLAGPIWRPEDIHTSYQGQPMIGELTRGRNARARTRRETRSPLPTAPRRARRLLPARLCACGCGRWFSPDRKDKWCFDRIHAIRWWQRRHPEAVKAARERFYSKADAVA